MPEVIDSLVDNLLTNVEKNHSVEKCVDNAYFSSKINKKPDTQTKYLPTPTADIPTTKDNKILNFIFLDVFLYFPKCFLLFNMGFVRRDIAYIIWNMPLDHSKIIC